MDLYAPVNNHFDLIKYLDTHPIPRTTKASRLHQFEKGAYIYSPPHRSNLVYEVMNGVIKVGSYAVDGREVPYDLVVPGDIFGNLNYLGGGHFHEYAKALTSVTVRSYPLNFFKEIIISDKTVAEWYHINSLKRWCRLEKRMFVICSENTLGRLNFLREQLNNTVRDNQNKETTIFETLNQTDIASLIGATRQTLAATLKKVAPPPSGKKREMKAGKRKG